MMLQVPWLLWISFRWAVDVDFTAGCLLPLPLPLLRLLMLLLLQER